MSAISTPLRLLTVAAIASLTVTGRPSLDAAGQTISHTGPLELSAETDVVDRPTSPSHLCPIYGIYSHSVPPPKLAGRTSATGAAGPFHPADELGVGEGGAAQGRLRIQPGGTGGGHRSQ